MNCIRANLKTPSPCGFALLVSLILAFSVGAAHGAERPRRTFRVWAASCSHVPADIRRGRESLALAIRQSEGLVAGAPAFDWDIMIDAGDLSAHQTPPGDQDVDGRSAVGTAASPGHAIEARYEHNVTRWLKMSFATSMYNGFWWNFEGNEFVLLDGNGFRNWMKVESRISERMLFQLKVTKDHQLPGTYLDNRDFGDELSPTPDATYVPRNDLYVRLQIDYSF